MSKIITNDYGEQYKTPSAWKTTGAVLAGSAVAGSIGTITEKFGLSPVTTMMQKTSKTVDNAVLHKAINDAFEKSGLKDKGVKILELKTPSQKVKGFVDVTNMPENNKRFYNMVMNSIPQKFRNSQIHKYFAEKNYKTFAYGKNAGFIPTNKNIVINIDEIGTAAFHEMGHAINKTSSKFWGFMQKMRVPSMTLASAFTTVALLKRKKVDGEEPKGSFDKITTFVKNNAGKLVALSFAPIIAEELMATYRGNKLAKEVMPKAFNKVKITNRYGALTYISTALVSGALAVVGSKVRDKIAKPKEITENI